MSPLKGLHQAGDSLGPSESLASLPGMQKQLEGFSGSSASDNGPTPLSQGCEIGCLLRPTA